MNKRKSKFLNPPEDINIFIIEGIAGAGKNTLHQHIKESLSDQLVYDYPEEELLCSWKHVFINNINQLRLEFMSNFLDYCRDILSKNPKAIFILNRFHISHYIFCTFSDPNFDFIK